MSIDPVYKMEIEREDAVAVKEYKGTTYYFCSEECEKSFVKEPEKFLGGQKKAGG